MNLVRVLKTLKEPKIIIGIDSSSASLAMSVYSRDFENTYLIDTVKFKFQPKSSMADKLELINSALPKVIKKYNPDAIRIEQTIYIQSPQTSRILSYIVGHIFGVCLEYCQDVNDVPVMTWKSHIGYKNVTMAEKNAWKILHGEKEAKKIAARQRKERTGILMKQKIEGIDDIEDDDIMDSIAIGYWALTDVL